MITSINDIGIDTIIGNKYKLVRLVSKGTFSSVYECEHLIKSTRAIIKMETNDIAKKLMKHELNMYLSLQNSKVRIPKIKNTGEDGNIFYIILELLDRNIREYNKPISSYDLFKQLYYLHSEKIVHRDIKPENMVVGRDGKVYLIDLGLSKVKDERINRGFTGNYRYASPFCLEKEYVYEYRDDVISLVYMLLDLKYGFLPWDYEIFSEMPRQTIDFKKIYMDEILCDILEICYDQFSYKSIFNILNNI
jgi:casein kinase 1 delta